MDGLTALVGRLGPGVGSHLALSWHSSVNPVNSWHKDATITIVTGIRIIITITINSKQVPHATTGQFLADAISEKFKLTILPSDSGNNRT